MSEDVLPTDAHNQEPASDAGRQNEERFLVVGLGASAGGIAALQAFFDGMAPNDDLAFVVVMHLSPDFESSLAQVLQAHTSIPVNQVTGPVRIAPNRVYVIPPNRHLVIQDGMLDLVQRERMEGPRFAVDLFFRTLAAAYRRRAVAVVLSGAGSDGVIGIRHIKEQGGVTLVQDPVEAEYDGMPRAAAATSLVDWVLPVAMMPTRLLSLASNERQIYVPPEWPPETGLEESGQAGAEPPVERQGPGVRDEAALAEVLRILRLQTGHDFACYKRATVLHRIARRLQVNLIANVPAYLDFLRSHPAEVTALLYDLLLNVTTFFRDPDAFAALQDCVPQLFAGKGRGDVVRAWVCGCATGEEAYSVAILLSEYAEQLDAPPAIQVFATDIDGEAIEVARKGAYPLTIEADVSPERLKRFFFSDQGYYRVGKQIRSRVLFAKHDVLTSSPFSRLDIITCRNLLIYLKPEAQEQVFDTFHFALRSGGLLFLGGVESPGDTHPLFSPLEKRHPLYVRRAGTRPDRPLRLPAAHGWPSLLTGAGPRTGTGETEATPDLPVHRNTQFEHLHRRLLQRFAPPSILINAGHDIIHLSEGAGRFLHLEGGEPSPNLMRVAHPALRAALRAALFHAVHENKNVTTRRVPVPLDGVVRLINLHVRPARATDEETGFVLVLFEPDDDLEAAAVAPVPADSPMAPYLEQELRQIQEQLSVTVEQYEASLEEQKSSNEEQLALNEELRSSAEELETSQEELQSINEELNTFNQELKSNLDELERANSDLQNLMISSEIGTLFLDRQLRIKRFTPRIRELFNIIPTDIGRPLSDLTHKLSYADLTAEAMAVLEDLRRQEREVSSAGRWFLVRLLPYLTSDHRIDGVVLTFVDITEHKQAQETLLQSEARFRALVGASSDMVYRMSPDWTEMRNFDGRGLLSDSRSAGRPWLDRYVPAEDRARVRQAIEEAIRTKSAFELEHRIQREDGSVGWTLSRAVPILDAHGEILEWFGAASDVTARKQAEEQRIALERETVLLAERNRMAQDLHDTLAQGFTGIRLQLEVAQLALEECPPQIEEGLRHVQRARDLAIQSHQEARRSIRALRSPLLTDVTLTEALQRLVEEAGDTVRVSFTVQGAPYPLSGLAENDLYRIAQEALTNALRHSGAGQIDVTLTYFDDEVHLTVHDNGRGFEPSPNRAGFGITGMQERAQRQGAKLEIASRPGQGTHVTLTLQASHESA